MSTSDRAAPAGSSDAPRNPAPATTAPIGDERYRVCFTADGAVYAQLQELRALMRHQVPDGDLSAILGRAIEELLRQVRKRKFAAVSKPRRTSAENQAPSRQIPATIRRAVASRDEGRCSYVSAGGARCGAREFLEFHHLEPWARTRTHAIDGIALRCRAHNQHAACLDFGQEHMARFWKRTGPAGYPRGTRGRGERVGKHHAPSNSEA